MKKNRLLFFKAPKMREHLYFLFYAIAISLLIFTCLPPTVNDVERGREPVKIAEPKDSFPDFHSKLVVDRSWNSLKSKRDSLARRRWRLTDVETYIVGGQRLYAAIWYPGSDGHKLWKSDGWAYFKNKWFEFGRQGYLLVDFEVFLENGDRKILGVWREREAHTQLVIELSWREFLKERKKLDKNFALIDVEVYASHGKVKYAGLWREKDGAERKKGNYKLWKANSFSNFRGKWREFGAEGYRLIDFEIFREGGMKKYLGVWMPGYSKDKEQGAYNEDNYSLWAEARWDSFRKQRQEFTEYRFQMVDLEVESGTSRRFSGIWRRGSSAYRDFPPVYKRLNSRGKEKDPYIR